MDKSGDGTMKNLGIIITVVLALIGGAVGYCEIRKATSETEKKVEEVKENVEKETDKREAKDEKHDESIDELEEFSIRQTILMQQVVDSIERLNEKIEK